MKKIKAGEYIRTIFGKILKITSSRDMGYIEKGNPYFKQQIEKHSPNIIDLIEIGDFIKIEYFSNRYFKRVERIFEVDCIIDKSVCFKNGHCTLNILSGEWSNQDKKLKPIIKSIVTKEQFKRMEYKV